MGESAGVVGGPSESAGIASRVKRRKGVLTGSIVVGGYFRLVLLCLSVFLLVNQCLVQGLSGELTNNNTSDKKSAAVQFAKRTTGNEESEAYYYGPEKVRLARSPAAEEKGKISRSARRKLASVSQFTRSNSSSSSDTTTTSRDDNAGGKCNV